MIVNQNTKDNKMIKSQTHTMGLAFLLLNFRLNFIICLGAMHMLHSTMYEFFCPPQTYEATN